MLNEKYIINKANRYKINKKAARLKDSILKYIVMYVKYQS